MILAVDWLLDRFLTVIDVWGDPCAAAVIDRQVDQLPEMVQPLTED